MQGTVVSSEPVVVQNLSVPIVDLPRALHGVRIAHISDLHFRRWDDVTRSAQELLLTLDYDLLAVTGDLGNFRRNWQKSGDLARQFFEPIAERGAIYAVLGNHDDPRLADVDLPLRYLRNESVSLDLSGVTLTLAGVDQSSPSAENLAVALKGQHAHGPTILLAHYPSTIYRLGAARVHLVLSGHTHGGQIHMPKWGCLWTNDRIPRRMSQGLHDVAGTAIHISSGVGVSLPLLMRWNCPPEVAILTLISSPAFVDSASERQTSTPNPLFSGSFV